MTLDSELSEEFDTGVEQDEILAKGGLYHTGLVPGTTWKGLLIAGIVVTVLGILLEILAHTSYYPLPDDFPTPFGSALILAVPLVGIVLLIAAFAVRAQGLREPPIEPIV